MIHIQTVLYILLTHFIGDFVLQTDWQAKNKSTSNEALLNHTLIYSVIWLPFIFYYHIAWFLPITFVCHTITDYFTSRLNTKLWAKNEVHYFFVSVGYDQLLHYVQLLLTYLILTQY